MEQCRPRPAHAPTMPSRRPTVGPPRDQFHESRRNGAAPSPSPKFLKLSAPRPSPARQVRPSTYLNQKVVPSCTSSPVHRGQQVRPTIGSAPRQTRPVGSNLRPISETGFLLLAALRRPQRKMDEVQHCRRYGDAIEDMDGEGSGEEGREGSASHVSPLSSAMDEEETQFSDRSSMNVLNQLKALLCQAKSEAMSLSLCALSSATACVTNAHLHLHDKDEDPDASASSTVLLRPSTNLSRDLRLWSGKGNQSDAIDDAGTCDTPVGAEIGRDEQRRESVVGPLSTTVNNEKQRGEVEVQGASENTAPVMIGRDAETRQTVVGSIFRSFQEENQPEQSQAPEGEVFKAITRRSVRSPRSGNVKAFIQAFEQKAAQGSDENKAAPSFRRRPRPTPIDPVGQQRCDQVPGDKSDVFKKMLDSVMADGVFGIGSTRSMGSINVDHSTIIMACADDGSGDGDSSDAQPRADDAAFVAQAIRVFDGAQRNRAYETGGVHDDKTANTRGKQVQRQIGALGSTAKVGANCTTSGRTTSAGRPSPLATRALANNAKPNVVKVPAAVVASNSSRTGSGRPTGSESISSTLSRRRGEVTAAGGTGGSYAAPVVAPVSAEAVVVLSPRAQLRKGFGFWSRPPSQGPSTPTRVGQSRLDQQPSKRVAPKVPSTAVTAARKDTPVKKAEKAKPTTSPSSGLRNAAGAQQRVASGGGSSTAGTKNPAAKQNTAGTKNESESWWTRLTRKAPAKTAAQ